MPRALSPRMLREASSWPVVDSRVSNPNVLMICGAGGLALARKSPEGDVLGLGVFLHYAHGPLEMGAQVYSGERDFQALVGTLAGEEDFPLRPVDLTVLSQMFWEALTFELEDEGSLEEEGVLLSSLVPHPSGNLPRQIFAPDGTLKAPSSTGQGMMNPDFLAIVLENRKFDLPEGKESVIFTRATFDVEDSEAILNRIRKDKDFIDQGDDGGDRVFAWTRGVP